MIVTRACMHTHSSSPSLSHTHTNPHNRVVPSRQLPSESCVCSRAPSPSRGYLFPVRGGRVAELRRVLGAAGLLWVASLLSSTKNLHNREETKLRSSWLPGSASRLQPGGRGILARPGSRRSFPASQPRSLKQLRAGRKRKNGELR